MASGSIQVQPAERIRGPNLRVLAPYRDRLPFKEAWLRAEGEGLVIASNARLDQALITEEWKQFPELWPANSGTMIGHAKPGEKLGTEIVYPDPLKNEKWIFQVPEEYRGEKDALLVAEHPNYSLRFEGEDIIVEPSSPSSIGIIRLFPSQKGWHAIDEVHKLPFGIQTNSANPDARYVWRAKESKVGPVVRDRGALDFDKRRSPCFDYGPSIGFGVAVEAPAEETEPTPTTVRKYTPEELENLSERAAEQLQALKASGVSEGQLSHINAIVEMMRSGLIGNDSA